MGTDSKELWKEICFLLSRNIKGEITEREFESQVIRAIEKLGWLEFRNEIVRQPTLHFGRGTLRPDIVLIGEDGQPIIAVEVKRPSEDISSEDSIGQLRSYMRQMKVDFGWLIGGELRVYYDGKANPHPSDPLLLEKIPFSDSIDKGINFVNMFSKGNFLSEKFIKYVNTNIGKYNEKREVQKLKKILLSDDTRSKIYNFLELEYADFGSNIFSKALSEIIIELTPKKKLMPGQRTVTPISPAKGLGPMRSKIKTNHDFHGKTFTLEELKNEYLDKTARPCKLIINDSVYTVRNWTDLTTTFVKWLYNNNLISASDIPIFNYSNRQEKYFINVEKRHYRVEKDAQWNRVGPYFVDTKYSAEGHKKNIIKALEHLQVKANISIAFAD